MGKIYGNITELIGKTPILELSRYENKIGTDAHILAKLEFFNPIGSVKDRIALNMIEGKERSGELKEGGTILEGTSGNTGIALAAIGAARGYKVKIAMPDNLSEERIRLIHAYGGEVILTPAKENMAGAGAKVAEINEQLDDGAIMGQGCNANNPGAHYKTTGPEIWEDTDGNVDIFVAACGTGGTISGTGRFLKEKNPDIKIIAVEPKGSAILNGGDPGLHKIQGIGGGTTPPVTDVELFDEVIDVTDEDAYEIARLIPRTEGFTIGISAGAAIWAAGEVAKRPENAGKKIVVIVPDSGDHYLTGDLYDY
ncbi:cysteine synthase A [Butyrivibrio sp. AE3004]|uniref:cysteine synthase A n=1 Tax=Butyrivibrio sp. AE3004 TaxID=1506994 RepID=UPI000493F6D1|nr:cysteine synthase A [Butyrivibrio sp. AE3004]